MDQENERTSDLDVEIPCPECDYNLKATTAERCPSCGWQIDYDVLLAQLSAKPDTRRYAVAFAALFVAIGTVLALASLWSRGRPLSLWDGFIVLSVCLASVGHLSLAYLALARRKRWPMRPGAASELLNFAAWLSMILAVVGAFQLLTDLPTQRVVRGVVVSGVLEFIIGAMLLVLPGGMLLVLRLVSFAATLAPSLSRNRVPAGSGLPARASFCFDVLQTYRADELTQEWSDVPRETTPLVEQLIERTWTEQSARAASRGQSLYDGRLIRLISARAGPGRLHLELGATGFRDFLGTNLYHAGEVVRENPNALANALGVSGIVLCSDHMMVLGRRSDKVAFHGGYLHTFGGLIEDCDRAASGACDVFAAMLRELLEEAAIRREEVRELTILGLIRDCELLQPELIFDVSLSITSKELRARFDPAAMDQEHSTLASVFAEPDAVIPFLRRAAPVAPVAEAALLLHGRRHFGPDWYEQTCYILFGELPSRTRHDRSLSAGAFTDSAADQTPRVESR